MPDPIAPAIAAEAERLLARLHPKNQIDERQQVLYTKERALWLYGQQADLLADDLHDLAFHPLRWVEPEGPMDAVAVEGEPAAANRAVPAAAHDRGLVPVGWQDTHYAANVQARDLRPGWSLLQPGKTENFVRPVRDVWTGWKLPGRSKRLHKKALTLGLPRLGVHVGGLSIPPGQQIRVLIPTT